MLISITVLDDLITEMEEAIRRQQSNYNSDKWIGTAMCRAMVDSKRRQLRSNERVDVIARTLTSG